MTVAELIQRLQQLNPTAEVTIWNNPDYDPVAGVWDNSLPEFQDVPDNAVVISEFNADGNYPD